MTEDIATRFGRRLRELRKAVGKSQEAFAYEAELDRSYIGQVERGERNITLKNIDQICRALQVPISTFFEGL